MKVLFLMDQMHLNGGTERILSQKLNYLANELNVETLLLTTEQKNKKPIYEISNKVKWKDLSIDYIRNLSYFHPFNLKKIYLHYQHLKIEIARINPEIIISVSTSPEQFLLPFMAKHIPKVKEFHSSGVTLKKPKSMVERQKHRLFMLFGKYDALVVLNADERKYYPFSNINVIPNFISLPKWEQIVTKEKTIIAAGRIAPVKQFNHLIQAWSLIADEHPDWQVKLFGDGDTELSEQLQQQIDTLQVPNFHLMGATNQLGIEMQKASIYAMTSVTECFPMVLLEAQEAGLSIVSYDCPNGPRHIVEHEINGLLTPVNEINFFAKALNKLITNEPLRTTMGNAAKHSVKTYSQQIVMQQWQDLFTSLKPQ